jgi:hypothetical protein
MQTITFKDTPKTAALLSSWGCKAGEAYPLHSIKTNGKLAKVEFTNGTRHSSLLPSDSFTVSEAKPVAKVAPADRFGSVREATEAVCCDEDRLQNQDWFAIQAKALGVAAVSPTAVYAVVEAELNRYLLTNFPSGKPLSERLKVAIALALKITAQSCRDAEMLTRQIFSTPLPIAVIAVALAELQQGDVVVEPCGGSGNLIAAAVNACRGIKVLYNEFTPSRVKAFQSVAEALGDMVMQTTTNAVGLHNRIEVLTGFESVDKLISNPPFSSEQPLLIEVDGKQVKSTRLGEWMTRQNLKMLKPDGIGVFILGKTSFPGNPLADKQFWSQLAKAGFTLEFAAQIDGRQYYRNGTTFDVCLFRVRRKVAPPDFNPVIHAEPVKDIEQLAALAQAFLDNPPVYEAYNPSVGSKPQRAVKAVPKREHAKPVETASHVPYKAADLGGIESGLLMEPRALAAIPDKDVSELIKNL